MQVRQIEQLKKTIEKDSPAYYRLDYLWGKTPEKEAQPGLKPDTASQRQQKQQEQNRQSLEARASQAVEELGLQPVIKVVRQKKAGRPPGSQNKVKPVPTLRKRRADVPAKAKLGMMAELDRLAIEKASKRQARLQLMKQYGVSETFCWNLQRSAKRQKVSSFVAKAATGSTGARQPGSHLALVHMVSQSAGKRVPDEGKALGRPDHLKSVWQETRAWALSEEARQHILTAGDVLLDFEDRLDAGQDRPGRAGRHETEERHFDKEQEAERQVPGQAPGKVRPEEQSLPADSQPLGGGGESQTRDSLAAVGQLAPAGSQP